MCYYICRYFPVLKHFYSSLIYALEHAKKRKIFQMWQKSHACQIRHLVFHISSDLAFAVLCAVLSWSAVFDSLQPMDCSLPGSSVHGDSPGRNTGASYHALLQGIFPTQGSNPGLPQCRQVLYQLSHKGCPRILEWVARCLL